MVRNNTEVGLTSHIKDDKVLTLVLIILIKNLFPHVANMRMSLKEGTCMSVLPAITRLC